MEMRRPAMAGRTWISNGFPILVRIHLLQGGIPSQKRTIGTNTVKPAMKHHRRQFFFGEKGIKSRINQGNREPTAKAPICGRRIVQIVRTVPQ